MALNIFSKADFSAPIENIAAYVFSSVRNKITDLFRRKFHQAVRKEDEYETYFDSLVSEFAEQLFGDADNNYSDDMKEKLLQAIDTLKPEYKEIIKAVDFQGYTFREYSEITGIPTGTLLSNKHRAMAALSKKLTHHF